MDAITRDAIVACAANGNMEHDFIGQVVKVYENSALVQILEHHADDCMNARELLHQVVISLRQMTVMTPGRPAEEEAAEALESAG